MTISPLSVLSIQSHVAYGYAGNRAAVFALQRMGYDVTAIHTVQFSNHTGYGEWEGDIFNGDHIRRIITGIENRGFFEHCAGLLTGYIGSPEIGEIILDVLPKLPNKCPWICDPVMGDVGRGIFVREFVPEFFKNRASYRAHVLTPNLFELEHLSGIEVTNTEKAIVACRNLHDAPLGGPEIILVTSLITQDTREDEISMLLSHKSGDVYKVVTPRFKMKYPSYAGSGDIASAIFSGCLLRGDDLPSALSFTAAVLHGIFKISFESGTREISLIAAQNQISAPSRFFPIEKLL